MSSPPPSVSVLITLEREREAARASIASWGGGQTYAGRVELVALSDAAQGPSAAELGDRRVTVVHRPEASRTELFDAAARQADTDLLVFTEAHCIAAPDCLEHLVASLDEADVIGACSRTTGIAENAFARLDQRLFEEGFAENSRPEDWRKVWPHGLVIERQAYLDYGGFDPAFHVFGEQLFSARVHRQGQRLAFAERALVEHHYGTELDEVVSHVGHATMGREHWESVGDSEDGLEALLWPPPGGRGSPDRTHAQLLALALARQAWARQLGGGRRAGIGVARRQLRSLAPAMLGRRLELGLERTRLLAALGRCHLWRRDEDRLEPAYRDLWARTVEHGRVRHRQAPAPPRLITGCGRRPIATVSNGLLAGFREPFVHRGEICRWSDAALAFETALPAGEYEIRLETGGLRPVAGLRGLAVFLGTRRLPESRVSASDDTVSLRPEPGWLDGKQRWIVVCAPVAIPQERTGYLLEVGLPMVAIDIRRI